MQSFLDNLVGDVRAVEVGGVDMVHARRDGFAEDGDGGIGILGRPKTPGPASCIAP